MTNLKTHMKYNVLEQPPHYIPLLLLEQPPHYIPLLLLEQPPHYTPLLLLEQPMTNLKTHVKYNVSAMTNLKTHAPVNKNYQKDTKNTRMC